MNWFRCWVVLFGVIGVVSLARHSLKEFEKLPHLRHWLHRMERQRDHGDPACSSPPGSIPLPTTEVRSSVLVSLPFLSNWISSFDAL